MSGRIEYALAVVLMLVPFLVLLAPDWRWRSTDRKGVRRERHREFPTYRHPGSRWFAGLSVVCYALIVVVRGSASWGAAIWFVAGVVVLLRPWSSLVATADGLLVREIRRTFIAWSQLARIVPPKGRDPLALVKTDGTRASAAAIRVLRLGQRRWVEDVVEDLRRRCPAP